MELLTDEDFEKAWEITGIAQEKFWAEYEALPEEEKKRIREQYDPGFVARMTDPIFDFEYDDDEEWD